MSLRSEIEANYTDANGLVSPHPCARTDVNPSANGVIYTGEYAMLLALHGEMGGIPHLLYLTAIQSCTLTPGLLCRGPGQPDLEAPDDYYGLAAGLEAAKAPVIARDFLAYGWKHWGSYNNVEPGKWTAESCLWRQPQLLCAMYAAANCAPLWIYPLRLYSALVIATSCIGKPLNDTDSRRLAWLLIKTLSPVSWTCRLASKLWYRRLYKHYGRDGMKAVRAIYYKGLPDGTPHPFVTWSVD